MKQNCKRIISLVLLMALLMGFLPQISVAHAEDASSTYPNGVSATLGEEQVSDGLNVRLAGDGNWNEAPETGVTDNGVGYWVMKPKSDEETTSFHLHGDVDDSYLHGVTGPIQIEVTYYDGDTAGGHFGMTYKAPDSNASLSGGVVELGGTGQWLTHTYELEDSQMINTHLTYDGYSDFRLELWVQDYGWSSQNVLISKVVVRKSTEELEPEEDKEWEYVTATLGEEQISDGLTMRIRGDSAWNETPETGVTEDGIGYWVMKPNTSDLNSFFMHGDVDDTYLYGETGKVQIEVTYYDGDTTGGHFGLNYKTASAAEKWGDLVTLGGTGQWLTHTFELDGAVFNNGHLSTLGYSDFRLGLWVSGASWSKTDVLISKVVVRKVAEEQEPEEDKEWEYVTATLGIEPEFDGLTMRIRGDGAWNETPETGVTADGVGYWVMKPKSQDLNSFYMHGDVDDSYLYGETDYVLLEVTYYDGDTAGGYFGLNHKTGEASEVRSDPVKLGGTGQWLTHTFVLDGAIFNNGHLSTLGYSDFRLGLYIPNVGMSSTEVLISKVVVRKAERPKFITGEIVTDNVGNIFYGSGNFDATLKLETNFEGENSFTINYVVEDHNGLSLVSGNWVETFQGPDSKTVSLDFLERVTAYGTYTLNLQILNDAGEELDNVVIPFSRIRSNEQLDWLGTCTHFGQDKSDSSINIPLIANGGIGYLRDEIYWSRVEKEKGVYDFSAYDKFVNDAIANDVEPLLILDYGNSLYGGGAPTTEEAIQAYANYCYALVEHYKGKVKYFEIWNEWNIGLGNVAPEDQDGTSYAKVLVAASEAVREANPDAYVLGIAIAKVDAEFIGDVLDYPGAYEALDAVVMHPYSHPRKPEGNLENSVSIMCGEFEKRNLEMLPIWITELGWPTTDSNSTVSETLGAAYTVRAMLYTMENQDLIQRFFIYDFQNDGVDRSEKENNFGLIDCWKDVEVPFSAKPAYAAVAAFAAQMNGYEFVSKTILNGDVHAYRFADTAGARDDMLVLWTEGTSKTIKLSANSGNVVVTDLFGNASTVDGTDVTVFVSDMPVYLTGDFPEEVAVWEADFTATGQYTAPAGTSFYITVDRNEEASQLSGTYELLLPEGWTVVSGNAFQSTETAEITTDQILVQIPESAAYGQYSISVKAVGEDGEVYCSQYLSVMVTELKDYELTPYLNSTDDFNDWSVAVKVNNFSKESERTGIARVYDATTEPEQLLGEAEYVVEPDGSMTLLFDMENPGQSVYTVKLVAVEADGNETVITRDISFLAAVALRDDQHITVDGTLDQAEWGDAMSYTLDNYEALIAESSGDEDVSATGYLKWDKDNLYMALLVVDDEHYQKATESTIWQGDSIQFSIDPTRSTEPGAEGNSQTGIALNDEDGIVYNYQWLACAGRSAQVLPDDTQIVVRRIGNITIYEAAIPWEYVTNSNFEAQENDIIGYSILVNDNDAGQREGFQEYMSGIGYTNDISLFGDLLLAGVPTAVHVHEWDEGVTTTEVTCAEPGEMTYTCTCGETRTEVIGALGHTFQDGNCMECGEQDPDYVESADPEEPTDPEQSTDPEEPADSKRPTDSEETIQPDSPETGDTYPLAIVLTIVIISFFASVGMIVVLFIKRKNLFK